MKRNSFLLMLLFGLNACVEKRLGPSTSRRPAAASMASAVSPTATVTPDLKYPQAKPLNEKAPVKILSDSLRYNDTKKETEFSGHVIAIQDTTTLKSDKLFSTSKGESAHAQGHVVLLDAVRHVEIQAAQGEYRDNLGEANLKGGVIMHSQDPYALPVTVTGETAWYRSLSRLANLTGGVTLFRGRVTATAKTADLCGDDDLATLEGDVKIYLGSRNEVLAKRAILRGKDKSIQFDGDVKAKLIPAEMKEASLHPER